MECDRVPAFRSTQVPLLSMFGAGSRSAWLVALAVVAVAALALPSVAGAKASVLSVSPHTLKFGKQTFNSFTTKTVTVTNLSTQTLYVTIADQSPDDFSPGQPDSTCQLSFTVNVLEAGQSCTMIVGFEPAPEFPGRETATLFISAADEQGTVLANRVVKISGTGVA
jgi:hypothetical protein